jgi:predicted dehydrogenase
MRRRRPDGAGHHTDTPEKAAQTTVNSASERIRVGIVGASVSGGASDWGAQAHVPALASLPDFELAAVCTSRAQSAADSAQRFGAALAFTDITEMARHPVVDLVVITLRVPSHRTAVLAALRGGTPVFCEWPLGVDLAEADHLATATTAAGLWSSTGLQARNEPAVRHARDMIAAHDLGNLSRVHLSQISTLQVACRRNREWMADRAAGAHPIAIHGGHTLDLLQTVVDRRITEVSAQVSTEVPEWVAENGRRIGVNAPDTCAFTGALDGGAEVSATIAAVPSGGAGSVNGMALTIEGTAGALRLYTPGPPSVGPITLAVRRGAGALESVAPPLAPDEAPPNTPTGAPLNVARAYVRLGAAWRRGDDRLPTDFADAVQLHTLLDAITRSSNSSAVTAVPISRIEQRTGRHRAATGNRALRS